MTHGYMLSDTGSNVYVQNLARALTDYLRLPDAERQRCSEAVQRNCVEHLGWGTLARRVVELAERDD